MKGNNMTFRIYLNGPHGACELVGDNVPADMLEDTIWQVLFGKSSAWTVTVGIAETE
jgi:hypothetical protein